ncbi:hypothetical protein NPIL_117381, partial [Nephila pilipes]
CALRALPSKAASVRAARLAAATCAKAKMGQAGHGNAARSRHLPASFFTKLAKENAILHFST